MGAKAPARAEPGLLTIAQAAEWLGISEKQTYRLVYDGHLPSVYIKTSRRVRRADLEAFVQKLPTRPW